MSTPQYLSVISALSEYLHYLNIYTIHRAAGAPERGVRDGGAGALGLGVLVPGLRRQHAHPGLPGADLAGRGGGPPHQPQVGCRGGYCPPAAGAGIVHQLQGRVLSEHYTILTLLSVSAGVTRCELGPLLPATAYQVAVYSQNTVGAAL